MAYTAGNLHLLAGGAPGKYTYQYDAGSDASATVAAAGYFNNTDDELNLAVDDLIVARCSDAVVTLIVASISSGAVTTRGVSEDIVDVGSTSANAPATGVTELTSTGAITVTLDAPFRGARKRLFKSASSTAIITVDADTATFDGSNSSATFDGAGEALDLVGLSATRWAIVSNTGSVGLS